MRVMGGGERLCCETIRALKTRRDELVLLSAEFLPGYLEEFFGYEGLFQGIQTIMYEADPRQRFGSYEHLLRHARAQRRFLSKDADFDMVFSTQDAGYVPDVSIPVLQWGYFPNPLSEGLYTLPLRMYYEWKIRRIALVLAISEYSKAAFDKTWKVPTRLVYPACNMLEPSQVRDNVVVTAARAVPEKRLELFWDVAKQCPNYDFVLLMTQDPRFLRYSFELLKLAPVNGRVIINPAKGIYQETLARSRFYLHLMKGEHFGITVVEAMSAGCVPIVHNSGGPKEIVDGCGFLWRTTEEIPEIFRLAESSFEKLSGLSMRRARVFSRERFDEKLGEVLEATFARFPKRDL